MILLLLNVFKMSSIFSAELHALYLAFDRVETADVDETFSFSTMYDFYKVCLFRPFGAETEHILSSSKYWNAIIG